MSSAGVQPAIVLGSRPLTETRPGLGCAAKSTRWQYQMAKSASAQVADTKSDGPIAQRLEQATHNRLVPGSNPGGPTSPTRYFAGGLNFKGKMQIQPCSQPLSIISIVYSVLQVVRHFARLHSRLLQTAKFCKSTIRLKPLWHRRGRIPSLSAVHLSLSEFLHEQLVADFNIVWHSGPGLI